MSDPAAFWENGQCKFDQFCYRGAFGCPLKAGEVGLGCLPGRLVFE